MIKNFTCLIFPTLLCLWSLTSASQVFEQITMHKTFGSTRFEYTKDTVTFSVSPKEVLQILGDDPLAYEEFWKAKRNYSISGLLGFVGAGLIAIPVATTIAGGSDPEWAFAAGGVALIIGSTQFSKAFNRHAESAVTMFNKRHTAFKPRVDYHFSGLGAKVSLKF
jgi:hypothetical protein